MSYKLTERIETIEELKKGMEIIREHRVYGTLYGFYYKTVDKVFKYKAKCIDGYEVKHFDIMYKSNSENKKIVEQFNFDQLIDQTLRTFDLTKLPNETKRKLYKIIMEDENI